MGLRLTEKEARAFGIKIPERPRSKYHNQPGRLDGVHFDSQTELLRYAYLVQVEMAAALSDLKIHPTYELLAARGGPAPRPDDGAGPAESAVVGSYEADFSYTDERGWVVEDVKGLVLPIYALKRAIFLANHPEAFFVEVRQCRKRWISTRITA